MTVLSDRTVAAQGSDLVETRFGRVAVMRSGPTSDHQEA
jgi:hypothetical protein